MKIIRKIYPEIISASRRTDLPSFYFSYIKSCIEKGKVLVENPFIKNQGYEVFISPEHTRIFVLWSRDFAKVIKNRSIFDGYNLFFEFTIVSGTYKWERQPVRLIHALNQLEKLSTLFIPSAINWRFDPIIISQGKSGLYTNYKEKEFFFLAKRISEMGVERCITSIVDVYGKVKKRLNKYNFPNILAIQDDSNARVLAVQVLSSMKSICKELNIDLKLCCEPELSNTIGIEKSACIDGKLYSEIFKLNITSKKRPTRKGCNCTYSVDIGSYIKHPCPRGCVYCYANPLII